MTDHSSTAPAIAVKDLWQVFGENAKPALRDARGAGDDKAIAQTLKDKGLIPAVRAANFEVKSGELFVIMGLSGSGKSTLIRCISRLIEPTSGSVSIDGEDILQANDKRLIIDGSFVNVRIEAPEATTRTLIPQAAIQRDQRGDFVLVVNDKQMVEQRYITTGEQVETAIIVLDGLQSGEAVIVEGLQRVRPGVAVDAVLTGQSEG